MNYSKRSLLVLLLSTIAGLSGLILQGCTCGRTDGALMCVTKGDAATAYVSAAYTAQTCPQDWKCVLLSDTSPQNAALVKTCSFPVAPSPVPVPVPGPGPGPIPNPGTGLNPGTNPLPGFQISQIAPTPARSCLRECNGGPTSTNCVRVTLNSAQALVASHLANSIMRDKVSKIEPNWLLNEFRMSADPCQRGTTMFDGGKASNRGAACIINSPVPDLQATVKIEIPALLTANLFLAPGSGSFAFAVPSQRPSVRLMTATASAPVTHPLNVRLGGPVLQLEANTSQIYIRTPGACVGAVYSAGTLF